MSHQFNASELFDFHLIEQALKFYENRGFTRIEVPWLVNKNVALTTIPKDKAYNAKRIENDGRCVIGSAEQGFLQLEVDGLIDHSKKYVSMSPCIRLGDIDENHREQFYKIELSAITKNQSHAISLANHFMSKANELFSTLLKTEKIYRQSQSLTMTDLMYEDLELGSYGYRQLENGTYLVYGTGLALPRLLMTNQSKQLGYHLKPIVKGALGEISKIIEELDELIDANQQQNKILQICELADLIGSIQLYANKLNVSIDELIQFSELTKKAFNDHTR